MRLRSTIPAVAATALLAAVLSAPAQAVADPTPTPSTSATDSPSASASASASSTASATTSATQTSTPAPTPTPTPVTQPTNGLPWAYSPQLQYGSGDHAVLLFWLDESGTSNTPPTATAVRFYPVGAPADAAPSLTLTDLQHDPYPSTGMWYSTTKVVLPAFGSYRLAVDARDAAGNFVTIPDAGTVTYQQIVKFGSFTATSPAPLDFDHRAYTLAGSLTVTDPGTGQVSPFSGAAVQLTNGIGNNGYSQALATVTTDANGAFSKDFVATGSVMPTAAYTPYGTDATTHTTANTQAPDLGVSVEQTRIRFTTATDVNAPVGRPANVSGVVERLVGATWVPAPGAPVTWSANWPNQGSGQTAADAQGAFTMSLTQAGSYSVSTSSTGFLQWASYAGEVTVHIPQPTSFTGLSITEDEFGEAAIDGHLKLGNTQDTFGTNGAKIYVQFSTNGRNWRWVGYTWLGRQGLAQDEFKCVALLGANANGYWRVYFAGTPDWRPVLSKAVRIWRYPTAVTGGRPSTTRAYKGQTLSFSGTVAQRTSSWHPLAHAKVMLLFRPHGSSTWYWVTIGWTDAHGRYSLRGRAYAGGTWAVLYVPTDTKHIDSVGPQTYVRVG